MSDLGCTNHGCPFTKSGGMKTNGPCKCVYNLIRRVKDGLLNTTLAAHEIDRELRDRNKRIEALEEELDKYSGIKQSPYGEAIPASEIFKRQEDKIAALEAVIEAARDYAGYSVGSCMPVKVAALQKLQRAIGRLEFNDG